MHPVRRCISGLAGAYRAIGAPVSGHMWADCLELTSQMLVIAVILSRKTNIFG